MVFVAISVLSSACAARPTPAVGSDADVRTPDAAATVGVPPAPHEPAPPARAEPPDPQTGDHLITRSHKTMGTLMTLTAWAEDDAAVVKAFDEVFAEFDRIDALMTTWTDDSDVSRINAAAGDGKPVKVSREVILVLERSLAASKQSNGAFDVTVGAFAGVWKFDEDKDDTIPDAALVKERLALVGWKDLVVDAKKGTARLKRKGQRITLGGIAKGYAVDRGVAMLRKAGLVDFIVQAGGDMYAAGKRGNRFWRVGIRDPRGGREDFFAFAEVADRTFSTSGDYERFVVKDGVRYHHILDPATGYPAMKCRSVTVMAKDALTADSLSKAFFILGPEAGMKMVEELADVEAVFVGADNKVTVSSGLVDRMKIVHDPTDGI